MMTLVMTLAVNVPLVKQLPKNRLSQLLVKPQRPNQNMTERVAQNDRVIRVLLPHLQQLLVAPVKINLVRSAPHATRNGHLNAAVKAVVAATLPNAKGKKNLDRKMNEATKEVGKKVGSELAIVRIDMVRRSERGIALRKKSVAETKTGIRRGTGKGQRIGIEGAEAVRKNVGNVAGMNADDKVEAILTK